MNIVCDTNVLLSGIVFGGIPRQILQLCATGQIINCISPAMLEEVEDVLHRPKFRLSVEQVRQIMVLLKETFAFVIPTVMVDEIITDPDDNRILETAYAGNAQAIISGDHHLLELHTWQGIPIMKPADFLHVYHFPC